MQRIALLVTLLLAAGAVSAATPPDRLSYQGVLRDAAGDPLDGSYDVVFRLWSAETLGDEILLDRHLTVNGQAIPVSGGMFATYVGDGEVLDGAGPGTYTTLMDVFADYGDVWLEIQVGAETLAPRLHVAASGYALNAGRLGGRDAGEFLDGSTTTQTKEGKLVLGTAVDSGNPYGIEAFGPAGGGFFQNDVTTASAWLGPADDGVRAIGADRGGWFQNLDTLASAELATDDFGVLASGPLAGGYFASTTTSAEAYLANGVIGVGGIGSGYGGHFRNSTNTGYAFIGRDTQGIEARGTAQGGAFYDLDGSGWAFLGFGDRGIEARGNEMGAYFKDINASGAAYLGYGDYGIQGYGNTAGAYFKDTDNTGYAWVGYADRGINGFGYAGGGYFNDTNDSSYAYVGSGTYKILGSGSVSFVQNHPDDPGKVVVYHAPESSEVGVYTRGSARLEKGVAVVALDPTLAWVGNPDLGLTAHLTPRGGFCPLYVESVETATLVVRSDDAACAGATFDYMVWALRIGFEGSTSVQPKHQEAYIPSMTMHEEIVRDAPELARYRAGERFATIARETLGRSPDTSRADALRDRIHVFDPAVDALPQPFDAPQAAQDVETPREVSRVAERAPDTAAAALEPVAATEPLALPVPSIPRMVVTEPAAAGDLLAVDERGEWTRAFLEADPAVAGVAAEESVEIDGTLQVAVAASGIVLLKVDADLGAVRPGDLLVASPTPGHAMRAYGAAPGTVIAKALEPLGTGQGTIRVLIAPR